MANDLNQSLYVEDEIDLKEIFKILIESKKLIISTILIFTTASIIYSLSLKPSFLTSTILEIGYFEMPDGNQKLIEKPSNLISDLKVLIMKNSDNKFNQNVSITSFEGKLINLETTSSSGEQNENLLTEIINYIDERHSNLAVLITNQQKHQISNEIDLIESEISFLIRVWLRQQEIARVNLEASISKLKSDLPILDQEISQLKQVIIDDSNNLNIVKGSTLAIERAASSPTLEQIISSYKSQINQLTRERNNSISDISILSQKLDDLKKNSLQSDELFKLEERKKALENYASQSDELFNLEERKKALENYASQSDELFDLERQQKTLENQLQMLMTQTQVKTQLIGNIETNTIKPKTQLIISLGLIFGFITGIFLVFINNFIKSYKEIQA